MLRLKSQGQFSTHLHSVELVSAVHFAREAQRWLLQVVQDLFLYHRSQTSKERSQPIVQIDLEHVSVMLVVSSVVRFRRLRWKSPQKLFPARATSQRTKV
jgi:hypothetical protein